MGPELVRLEGRVAVVPAFPTEEVRATGVRTEPEKTSKNFSLSVWTNWGGG